MSKSALFDLKKLNEFEIVFIAVVSVTLGVSFWGWTFFYELTKPFLKVYGLNYLTNGFWILASIFLSFIVRKPGVAILASLIASGVQAMLTQWGMVSLLWGLVQGIGAEIIFCLFFYRVWNIGVLVIASIASAFLSYCLDYMMYGYGGSSFQLQLTQLISSVVSSIFLAGFLSYYLGHKLKKLGLLNKFKIVQDYV